MPLSAALQLLLSLCLLHSATAHYRFTDSIPNGARVPNPCEEGSVWEGVGHQNPAGAGVRNPFGLDFAAAGYRWTESLCRKDSDGDGRSNGEELGDPGCVWRPGATPARTSGISHPGLCPLDSTTCTNSWPVCPKKFSCPALAKPGVYVRNVTLKETRVPPQETTYMCQAFELNNTAGGVHMIGSLPIIRNKHVMHHMIIYACEKKPNDGLFTTPKSCFMGDSGCIEIINLWAYGVEGECFNEQAGVLIGGAGYRYGMLELHWNNPQKVSTYTDSSGFSLYFTDSLRPFNQGFLIYGELNLVLPPKQPLISYNHTCPGQCTEAYHTETRYITNAAVHMHSYGAKGRATLWRGGRMVQELVPLHKYDYNSPTFKVFETPVEFRKGDEVKTECYFSTEHTTQSVFWGYDTSQEMCFTFLTYYPNNLTQSPQQKLSRCFAHGGINTCRFSLPGDHIESGCNVTALRSGEAAGQALTSMAWNNCFHTGCYPTCRSFLNNTFWPANACFDPRRSKRMAETLGMRSYLASGPNSTAKQTIASGAQLVLNAQSYCERELQMLALPSSPTPLPTGPPLHGRGRVLTSGHLLAIILVCSCLGMLVIIVALGVLGMKLRATQGTLSKGKYEVDQSTVFEKKIAQPQ